MGTPCFGEERDRALAVGVADARRPVDDARAAPLPGRELLDDRDPLAHDEEKRRHGPKSPASGSSSGVFRDTSKPRAASSSPVAAQDLGVVGLAARRVRELAVDAPAARALGAPSDRGGRQLLGRREVLGAVDVDDLFDLEGLDRLARLREPGEEVAQAAELVRDAEPPHLLREDVDPGGHGVARSIRRRPRPGRSARC